MGYYKEIKRYLNFNVVKEVIIVIKITVAIIIRANSIFIQGFVITIIFIKVIIINIENLLLLLLD